MKHILFLILIVTTQSAAAQSQSLNAVADDYFRNRNFNGTVLLATAGTTDYAASRGRRTDSAIHL